MQKITQELVDEMNKEVTADNFESIVDKYHLDTPEKFSHEKLCEQDGVEVWGIGDNELLVYDNVNGFYLLSFGKWIQEVMNIFEDEADEILHDLGIEIHIMHEFKINGYEAVEKTVASGNQSSARINVPPSWQGKRVMVVRLE